MNTLISEVHSSEKKEELWELVGSHWSLPIWVHDEDQHAIVELAVVPLLKAQRAAALAELEPIRNGDVFVTTREHLATMARKSEATDPEDIVEWRAKESTANHFPKHPGVDEFLDFYCAKGVVRNRATLSAIYSTLCTAMVEWTLKTGKPIPLIFATLYPLLYRKNWKELVHYKMGQVWSRHRDELLLALDNVLGVHPHQAQRKKITVAAWSLNLVHEPLFDESAKRAEMLVVKNKNYDKGKYWESVRQRIKNQLTRAKFIYADYRKAVRQANASSPICPSRGPRGKYARKKSYGKDGRLYSLEHLPYWRGKRAEQGKCGAVVRADAPVPPLPGVQPETPDLRNGGADMAK